jgi:hypothetical protein
MQKLCFTIAILVINVLIFDLNSLENKFLGFRISLLIRLKLSSNMYFVKFVIPSVSVKLSTFVLYSFQLKFGIFWTMLSKFNFKSKAYDIK